VLCCLGTCVRGATGCVGGGVWTRVAFHSLFVRHWQLLVCAFVISCTASSMHNRAGVRSDCFFSSSQCLLPSMCLALGIDGSMGWGPVAWWYASQGVAFRWFLLILTKLVMAAVGFVGSMKVVLGTLHPYSQRLQCTTSDLIQEIQTVQCNGSTMYCRCCAVPEVLSDCLSCPGYT
jgi:hypothetical protein